MTVKGIGRGKGGGRPPITENTPLSEQEERYVQAVVAGSTKRQALLAAGYPIPAGTTIACLQQKAKRLEERLNIKARLLALAAERTGANSRPPPTPPPGLGSFDPINIDQTWLNAQAFHVHQQAVSVEDFSSALRALEFIGRLNGVIKPKNPVGQPPKHVNPMRGQTDGNYRPEGADTQSAEEPEGDDLLSGLFDDGVGDSDTAGDGDEPFFRQSRVDQAHQGKGTGTQRGQSAERGAGLAGEGGEALFEEIEGE